MRRLAIILLLTLLFVGTISAQKVAIGSRAPRIERVEWLSDRPDMVGRAMLVEFFHSSNTICRSRIDYCNRLAAELTDSLTLVIVAREPEEQIAPLLFKEYQYYYIAVDSSGELCKSYGVPYVPYSVVVGRRGIVRWTGNSQTLDLPTLHTIIGL